MPASVVAPCCFYNPTYITLLIIPLYTHSTSHTGTKDRNEPALDARAKDIQDWSDLRSFSLQQPNHFVLQRLRGPLESIERHWVSAPLLRTGCVFVHVQVVCLCVRWGWCSP